MFPDPHRNLAVLASTTAFPGCKPSPCMCRTWCPQFYRPIRVSGFRPGTVDRTAWLPVGSLGIVWERDVRRDARQVYAIAMALAMRGGLPWPETRNEAMVLLRRLIDRGPGCSTIGQGEP